MTSIPASRSARAITFAPRSWPSSPGFAMTTLSLRIHRRNRREPASYYRDLFVLAPDLPQRVAHLADRRVGADGVKNRRHQVRRRLRRRAQGLKRSRGGILVAGSPQPFELRQLLLGCRLIDVENLQRRFDRLHKV